jgi:hypothetical protein
VCGNAIDETSCRDDFGTAAIFCRDCLCASHSAAGFGTSPGTCVRRSSRLPRPHPTRRPRPPRPPR